MLNSRHPAIKFTAEYSLDKVKFLVVEVIRSGSKLFKDLYTKPMNTHRYLEFLSCHVIHAFLQNLFHIVTLFVSTGFVREIEFSVINVINLSAGINIDVTMKSLLDNKFLYLTKILILGRETNLSLVLLNILHIQNLLYQI